MHYIWANRLFPQNNLTTVDGRQLQIINPGTVNNGAGPDFFNASVIIDGQLWAGNVEIHLRASDWHRHHHTEDPAYQTVILHVVDTDDMPIYRSNGLLIPQFAMKCNPALNSDFRRLADFSVDTLPCIEALHQMPAIYLTDWITALGFERLHDKVDRIDRIVADSAGDWNEAGFITIARALGFGINADPMERLARATPLRIIRRHADDRFIIESILLGQARLIEQAHGKCSYADRMSAEYAFFATKFGIKSPDALCWKFSRTRPQNAPFRRISYLAGLLCSAPDFIANLLSIENLQQAYQLLNAHRNIPAGLPAGTATPAQTDCTLSRSSIDLLIINAVIPLAYAYATSRGEYTRARAIAELLHEMKPESNRFTAMFATAGVTIPSAFASQAIVQLRREYCEKRKCLYCRIGHRHLSACALRQ